VTKIDGSRPIPGLFGVIMQRLVPVGMFLALCLSGFLCVAQNPSAVSEFDKLVDEAFDSYYKFNPTTATADGFHQYDTQLEDFSQASISAQIAESKRFLDRFQSFPKAGLSETSVGDLEFWISRIQASLLELETVQMWRKDRIKPLKAKNRAVHVDLFQQVALIGFGDQLFGQLRDVAGA